MSEKGLEDGQWTYFTSGVLGAIIHVSGGQKLQF